MNICIALYWLLIILNTCYNMLNALDLKTFGATLIYIIIAGKY
jgi:hypothetical protein